MQRYTENFTLADIFNNKSLGGKLPLVNYREINITTREGSDVAYKTTMKTVKRQIFEIATGVARQYYKPLEIMKSEDMIEFGGNLIYDQDACVDMIVAMLRAYKPMLDFSANNGDIIRSAMRESAKGQRRYGITPKLFLRAQSMLEIRGMNRKDLQKFMDDVMSNILFGDNFPETQKRYKVYEQNYGKKTYEEMRKAWREKVGI